MTHRERQGTVLYCHTSSPGGAELAAPALARALDAEIWVRGAGPDAWENDCPPVPTRHFSKTADSRSTFGASRARSLAELVRVNAELTSALKTTSPAVVISNNLQGLLHIAIPALLNRVPLVAYARDLGAGGNRSWLEVQVYRVLLRLAKLRVYNSQSTRVSWRVRGKDLVVPTAVPEKFFDLDRSNQDGTALMLGRVSTWKGQRQVVEALGIMPAGREIELNIVGGALFGEEIEFTHHANVHLIGHSDSPEHWLARARVLIHASITPEPFGQVCAQAAAAGTPIVCADSGGQAEWLEDGVSCLMVNPQQIDTIRDALLRILEDPAGADARARTARRAAEAFRSDVAYARLAAQVTSLANSANLN